MIFIKSHQINDRLLTALSNNEPNPTNYYRRHKLRLHTLKLLLEMNIWLWMLPFIKGWRGVEKNTIYTHLGLPDFTFGFITPTIFALIALYLILRVRSEMGLVVAVCIRR